MPDYVISNYIVVGKPRLVLIDGPLVVLDYKNSLKAVVFFNGLIKQSHLFSFEYVANSESKKNVVEGLIYKFNKKKVD